MSCKIGREGEEKRGGEGRGGEEGRRGEGRKRGEERKTGEEKWSKQWREKEGGELFHFVAK